MDVSFTPHDQLPEQVNEQLPKKSKITAPMIACAAGVIFLVVSTGIFLSSRGEVTEAIEQPTTSETANTGADSPNENNNVADRKTALNDDLDEQKDEDSQKNVFEGEIFAAVLGEIPEGWDYEYTEANNGTAELFELSKGDATLSISVSLPFDAPEVLVQPCYDDFLPISDTVARVRFQDSFDGRSHYRYYEGYESVLAFEGEDLYETAIFANGISEDERESIEACGTTTIPFGSQAPLTQADIDTGTLNKLAWMTIDFFGEDQEALARADALVNELNY